MTGTLAASDTFHRTVLRLHGFLPAFSVFCEGKLIIEIHPDRYINARRTAVAAVEPFIYAQH